MTATGKDIYRTQMYDLRIKNNLRRIEVATAIKKSIVFVEGIERGEREPKMGAAKKFANLYKVELDDIFEAIKKPSKI